jgi:acyl carrier protein
MKTFDDILSELFKVPKERITDELSSKDISEWDSMNYLLFIAELEKNFNMSFSMNEVMNALTVGDIRKVVKERGKQ